MASVSLTDAELWRSWCSGDSRSGRALFDRYFGNISRFFASKVQGDTDDLVQETFANCFAARERVRDPEHFRSYLFGIAYNLLRAHYREQRGVTVIDFEECSVHDLGAGPSTLLRGEEQQRLLAEALTRIPLELQVVVELSYWEALDSSEIGRVLDAPPATVRTRLRRARQLLAEQIETQPGSDVARARASEALDAWAARIHASLDDAS